MKEKILMETDAIRAEKSGFKVGINLHKSDKNIKIDQSKIVDLDEEMNDEDIAAMLGNKSELVIDLGKVKDFNEDEDQETRMKKSKEQGKDRKKQRVEEELAAIKEKEQFDKDYVKMGGIQHIICSATMIIDNKGRITPRQQKMMKKKGTEDKQNETTLEALCQRLKFRSKNPKVIDLNLDENGG